MPKKAKQLSALEVKRLSKVPGFHAVGGVAGLHLLVSETPVASWILRIVVGDRRPDIGLGGYPDVTLEAAHQRAREARDQVRLGIDPVAARKAARAALRVARVKSITFDEAVEAVFKAKAHEFRNAKYRDQWRDPIAKYASPFIGSMSVDTIDNRALISVLEPIWTTVTETAVRLRGRIEKVLAWSIVAGHRSGPNPAQWRGNLELLLAKPSKVRKVVHHASVPWEDVGQFYADLREREGLAARALEFVLLTATRSGEVRLAVWDEFDLDSKLWSIPAERMKSNRKHEVPLSEPALRLLKWLPKFEGATYVFPGLRGGPMSDMSLTAVMRRMNVKAVPHGLRSTFKDWARSATRYADEVSELQLAHVNNDSTRAAYARDGLLPKRALLMRDWAKFCGKCKTPRGDK